MPHFTFPIAPDGLAVTVLIGSGRPRMEALLAQGKLLPAPITIRGVIDNGSDVTAIAPRVFQKLGLESDERVRTHTAGGEVEVPVFEVSLSIPEPGGTPQPMLVRERLLVTELAVGLPDVEVLVGMDVLKQILLILDGPAQRFTLAF